MINGIAIDKKEINRVIKEAKLKGLAARRALNSIAERELFVFELDTALWMEGGMIQDESLHILYRMLLNGKKIVIFSTSRFNMIEDVLENSLTHYIDTYRLNCYPFKDLLLYSDGGIRKYLFNISAFNFREVVEYRERVNFSTSDILKIRSLISQNQGLRGRGKRGIVIYQRIDGTIEQFDIYGLTDEYRKEIIKRAKRIEVGGQDGPILTQAINEICRQRDRIAEERGRKINPKIMVNLAEQPVIYYLLYGLASPSYYAQKDGDFTQRRTVIKKLMDLLRRNHIKGVVELGGSRGIAIRPVSKGYALKDALRHFGLNDNKKAALVIDAFRPEENMLSMVYSNDIAIINIGPKIKSAKFDCLVQAEYFIGHRAAATWLSLIFSSELPSLGSYIFQGRLISVLMVLLRRPDILSEEISRGLGLDLNGLLEIYDFISGLPLVRELLIHNSKYPEFTFHTSEMLHYSEHINNIINGRTTFPSIMEIHLGRFCNHNCLMCFSHAADYEEELESKHHEYFQDVIKILNMGLDKRNNRLESDHLENKLHAIERCIKPEIQDKIKQILGDETLSVDERIREVETEDKKLKASVEPFDEGEIECLLKECRENGVEEIWFSGGKEPFCAGRVVDHAIRRANEIGFLTRVYTNAEFIDVNGRMEIMLASSQIRISMNGATPSVYASIHFPKTHSKDYFYAAHNRDGRKVFYRVKKNIEDLVKLRDEKLFVPERRNKSKIKIAISFIVQPLNHHQILDFVWMAYKMGVDSVQLRAEAVGNVREFMLQEKATILKQVYELKRRYKHGDFAGMKIELRGLTREELDAKKEEEQFLPGLKRPILCRAGALKRGVNPYLRVYNCEFCMHPENAKREPYRDRKLGDLREKSFAKIMGEARRFYKETCTVGNGKEGCQAHEYGMNITLEKLTEDSRWGIPPDRQPYYDNSIRINKILVVGMGRWGVNVVMPVLDNLLPPKVEIYALARSNFQWVKETFSSSNRIRVEPAERLDDLLSRQDITAVIITTQFSNHYALIKKALEAGKDVFTEKPIADTLQKTKELINIAKENRLLLQVGYQYMTEDDFYKLKILMRKGFFGQIRRVNLTMLNPVDGRNLDYSSNVIEDLCVHKLSILLMLFGRQQIIDPQLKGKGEYANIKFRYGKVSVNIELDRNYKGKRSRKVEIFGDRAGIALDYTSPDRAINFEVFDSKGEIVNSASSLYPEILKKTNEIRFLEAEFRTFFESVRTRNKPFTTAEATIMISEAIDKFNSLMSFQKEKSEKVVVNTILK